MSQQVVFDVGDWIVHAYYGLGQIESVEVRPVQGEQTDCFRVLTPDAEYWVPVERVENPRIRPVASRTRMQRALRAMITKPEMMNKNYRTRRMRIVEVFGNGSLLEMARLLRDLRGRQVARTLNATEMTALDNLKERFTREWAVAMEIKLEIASARLDEALQTIEAVQ